MNELALYIYPLPKGTSFNAKDLSEPKNVEILFDYMQILLAVISKEGWDFLINKYGYEQLFSINQKSEWIDCETITEFTNKIKYYKEISPDKL